MRKFRPFINISRRFFAPRATFDSTSMVSRKEANESLKNTFEPKPMVEFQDDMSQDDDLSETLLQGQDHYL
jgi:hypothetical protein